MWLSPSHREPIEPPSVARKNAQLRQIIRLGKCVHTKSALSLNQTVGGGFIEYCTECMTVTEIYTPQKR